MCQGDTWNKPDEDGHRVCGKCRHNYETLIVIIKKVMKNPNRSFCKRFYEEEERELQNA